MDQGLRNKIQELRNKASFFLSNEISAFIKDKNNSYYFCKILPSNETHLILYNFEGKKKDTESKILWVDVKSINEYEKKNG